MRKLLFILFFSACFVIANAQDSLKYPLADKYYQLSEQAFSDEIYDTACKYADLHLEVELGFNAPRSSKVLVSYITKAFCEFRQGNYKQSIEVYNKGIKWMDKNGSAKFAKSFFDFIDLCYTMMEATDKVYFEYSDKDYRKTFLFRVEEVLWRKGTTFRLRINAGLNDGLIMGAVAFPISAPLPDSIPERLFQLGKGEVVEIGPWSAEVEVDIYDSTDTYNWVKEGDIIETRIFSKFKEETIIYELLSKDVSFRDNNRDRMLNPRYIIHYDSKEFKELLLLLMADQVFDTEEFTREGDIFVNPAVKGQNQGKSIHDLFLEPDTADIEDYLEFVAYFPRKYMGKDYKVNETYATWLLNNSPSTPYVILDSLLVENDPLRRMQIFEFNKTDLIDDFYEKWAEKATAYADKQDFNSALKTLDLVFEAGSLFNNKKIMVHGLYKKGTVLGEQNMYEQAIASYDSASKLYLLLKDTIEHIRSIYKMADIYGDWARYKQAEQYFDIAQQKLRKKIGKGGSYEENELLAYILWDKGYNVSQRGDYDNALKAYDEAEKILDRIGGSKTDRATIYRNMAYVSKQKGLYLQAVDKYSQSMQLFLEDGNQKKYATLNDDIADSYFKMGKYREAIVHYQKAYEIKLGMDDKSGAGFSKSNIGQAYWNLGTYDTAIMAHREAVSLNAEANDIVGIAYSYEKIGDLWKENGNLDSSVSYYFKAEENYIANNDTTDKLAALKVLFGDLYLKMKNYDLAIYYYKRAQQIYAGIQNDLGVANGNYNIGMAYYNMKSFVQAKNYMSKANVTYTKIEDNGGMMNTQVLLGLIAYDSEGNGPEAEKLLNNGLNYAKISNSFINLAWVWENLGYINTQQGKLDNAKAYYDLALDAYTKAESYSGIGGVKLRIGRYYIEKGEFAKTREIYWSVINDALERKNFYLASDGFVELAHYYNLVGEADSAKSLAYQSLDINKTLRNDYIQASAYLILGNTYNALTQYNTAIEHYRTADSIYRSIDDVINQVVAKNNIGTIYFAQGEYSSAIRIFGSVLEDLNRIKYEGDFLVSALLNLGETYLEDGFWAEAERWTKEGLAVAIKQKNRRQITSGNLLLGHLFLNMKKYPEAKSHLFNSYKDYLEIGEKDRISEANTLIGKLYVETGKTDSARVFLNKAIEIATQTGNNYYLWEPLYLSSTLYLKKGDTTNAVADLKKSVEVVEGIKRNIAGRSNKMVSFSKAKDKYKIYLSLVDLLVSQNEVSLAFYYQEKSNIAGLMEQTRGDNGPTRTNDLLDAETETTAKELELKIDGYLAELIKERSKPKEKQSAEKIKSLEGLIDVSQTNYNTFIDSAMKNSDDEHKNFGSTINPRQLDDARNSLPDGDVVIEYLVTENQLIIFVATNSTLNARRVAIKQEELNKAVKEFYTQVSTSKTDAKLVAANSNKLYQLFITPITDLIEGQKRIALVPTGVLYSLPIQALGKLEDGKMQYLITKYDITYINNTKFIYQAQPNGEIVVKGILCFGNADNTLSNAEKEVNEISALFPSKIFVRDSASEDKAKLLMNNYTIVHFATHGRLDPIKFENSYLVLTPNTLTGDDGKFTMNEIREFKTLRGIRLMVLSACDMAANENINGWVNTPANEFVLKGVGSVVAPQWKVHDEATSVLMVGFYENLKNGMGISEALKTSQMAMAQSANFSHPYYWGAFEIIGKW
ncbi:MAG: tetratricopeptide repeat protein [Bacteroidota bacterium]